MKTEYVMLTFCVNSTLMFKEGFVSVIYVSAPMGQMFEYVLL